jgi:hypothetical protein
MVGYKTYAKTIIPSLNPFSRDYKTFWATEKRKCIEGTWIEGKYMPGILYFFVNYWTIELNKTSTAKVKSLGQPFLRDLEWERAYYTIEARGFSGFADDPDISCHRGLAEAYDPTQWNFLPKSCFKKDGTPKRYVDAREYLFREHPKDLGKPLFENEARNVIDIEARGGGKSFWMSVTIAHNFLFDGATDYDELKAAQDEEQPLTSETLIGAIDSFYSNTLINKVQLGLNNLRGGMSYGNKIYPSPLSKAYSGSWTSGKHVLAEVDVKKGGNWEKQGSRSKIQHRSFKDNPYAGNGTRPGWSCFEEIGFFDNLIDALGQMKEATADGAVKFGSIWMSGTGGDMVGGATEAAKEVFYNPEKYDAISFTDEFEGSPFKIGMFMPAWKTLNQFKDDKGNTIKEPALNFLEKARERAKKGSDKKAHNDELQQRPIVPSEAFLLTTGNVFPIGDLIEHLKWLETSTDGDVIGQSGEMIIVDGKIEFKPYTKKSDPKPCDYPVKKGEDHTGAVQIWQHPDPNAAYGWVVAGNDPYDLDEAVNSSSLGSLILIQRATVGSGNHDKVVAEYTARPGSAKTYYEQARRLLLYYNALCLYENEKIGIKTYFEQKHSLHLLAYTPTILKANQSSKVSRVYGQNMTKNIKKDGRSSGVKAELEVFLRDWLQEDIGDGRMNLHSIYSKPIIKELISYNDVGNYDRVIALMLAVAQREQMFNLVIEEKEEEIQRDDFFNRGFFQQNTNPFQL